jgi:diguanylate cyclase (GGDEF)-like protein
MFFNFLACAKYLAWSAVLAIAGLSWPAVADWAATEPPLSPLLSLMAQAAGAAVACGVVGVAAYLVGTTTRRKPVGPWAKALGAGDTDALKALQSLGHGVITTDANGLLQYVNPEAQAILGQPLSLLASMTLSDILQPFPNGSPTGTRAVALAKPDGSTVYVEPSVIPIHGRHGENVGSVMVLQDVTQASKMASQLDWQTTHDVLTGLINRVEFERQVAATLARTREFGTPACVCLIDLDQFKIVNDLCGHGAGDKLLREMADLLKGQLRRSDIVARLSGDEFGLLLEDCATEKGVELAHKLLQAAHDWRFHWEGKVFVIGMSIGLVPTDRHFGDVSNLLSIADTVCYSAKENGRNRVEVFASNDAVMIHRKGEMDWAERITRALDTDRFVLYEQRYRNLSSSCDRNHRELLVRMVNDDGSIIAPDAFIPAAERFNLMCRLDQWVTRKSFAIFTQCGDRHTDRWSINLSGQSLSVKSTFETIMCQAEAHDIDPQAFCFEITETAAIRSMSFAADLIANLRRQGFTFALDDFGSGLSSFEYLKNIPVDYLKIDGVFVRNIINDRVNHVTVKAITEVGHAMNLKVIAEFVEDEASIIRLSELGVDFAQGYGVARPTPLTPLTASQATAVTSRGEYR